MGNFPTSKPDRAQVFVPPSLLTTNAEGEFGGAQAFLSMCTNRQAAYKESGFLQGTQHGVLGSRHGYTTKCYN